MAFSLYYYAVAKTDLIEAKGWYKKQKPGLEKMFALEVKNCIYRFQKNPFQYEIKYKNIRTAFTAIFPYVIHFYVDEPNQQIVIIAILHQSRDPALPNHRDNNE